MSDERTLRTLALAWRDANRACPAVIETLRAAKRSASDFEQAVESVRADTSISEAEAQALAAKLRGNATR